jgi:hypothetical protein
VREQIDQLAVVFDDLFEKVPHFQRIIGTPEERVPMFIAMRDSLDGKPAGQEETGPKVTVIIGMAAPRDEEMTVLIPSTSGPKALAPPPEES